MAEFTIHNLYQKYKNDVYLYLISLTHDQILSEDLTSETFLGAIKSISKYKGESDIKKMCIRDRYRRENAGMSSENYVRIIMAESLRILEEGSSAPS